MTATQRTVVSVISAHRQLEGAGFVVRRPFPTAGLSMVDPFLMLDEMGPVEHAPGEAIGAPDHPHRGFETVTYILEGEGEHEDSAGHRGVIGPGAVQWMTAGSGVVHSEMPSRRMQREGGRMHGFQLWVNLPARDKMMAPRYQEIPAAQIPTAVSADGLASARVIAGEALGARARIETRTPILYQDWTLRPGASIDQPIPVGWKGFAYVFSGTASVGARRGEAEPVSGARRGEAEPVSGARRGEAEPVSGAEGREVSDGQLGVLGEGEVIHLACSVDAKQDARLLLLAGVPLREPVARYGPFVMNTEAEIRRAIADYQSGRMGRIVRG